MSNKNDEIARWQQAIYELCQEHYPDVDGSGCDSGDELDLTLAEISEVFNMYQDQIDDMYNVFLAVIEAEILWCNQNPDKAFTAEYRKGFINGLVQARLLITKAKGAETS